MKTQNELEKIGTAIFSIECTRSLNNVFPIHFELSLRKCCFRGGGTVTMIIVLWSLTYVLYIEYLFFVTRGGTSKKMRKIISWKYETNVVTDRYGIH